MCAEARGCAWRWPTTPTPPIDSSRSRQHRNPTSDDCDADSENDQCDSMRWPRAQKAHERHGGHADTCYGVEKHRVYRGTLVSRGALFLGGPCTNPHGLMGPGGSARRGPRAHLGGADRRPRRPPPQQGWVRSRVRKCEGPPPAGCYPQAAGRRGAVDWRPPPPSPGGSVHPSRREGWGWFGAGSPPTPKGGWGVWAGIGALDSYGTPSGDFVTPRGGVTPCGGRGRGHGATRGRRGRQRSEGPPEVGGATRGRRGHQRSKGPPEV